jgi:hypothetical protein
MGIVYEIYSWIEDWLIDRKQRVILVGANSDWIGVRIGVLQLGFSLETVVIYCST